MKQSDTSRRTFLKKMAGTLALSGIAGYEQKIFSTDLPMRSTTAGISSQSDKKFVPVMITPFKSDLSIDYDGLSGLIDFYLTSGAKGFFANCASSEMYHLNDDERLALTRHVVKRVNGAFPVVATGSFGPSVEEKAEFAKKMYDTGVNAVILIPSLFAAKDQNDAYLIDELKKFFWLTGSVPMGTYECPSPYKRIVTPEVLRYLLSTNRLIYHKDTSLDVNKVKEKVEIAKNSHLEVFDAHTPNALQSLQSGVKGISCIAGNFYPEMFAWMCSNVNDPSLQDELKWLQSELTRADAVISQGYPISAKYFLQKRGVPIDTYTRTSKSKLTMEQQQALEQIFKDLGAWSNKLEIQSPK
jgi:4-hydroxy-tetrahydrodipicolinate synthase